jgi:hypothetical protein
VLSCEVPFCESEFPPAPKREHFLTKIQIHYTSENAQINSFIGDWIMKHKVFALILALTVVSWAQTSTPATPSAPADNTATEKAKCACCGKMAASAKDGHAACMRHGKGDAKDMASCCAGKEGSSCCGGKDAKSCMKDKTAASCCKDKKASCCGGKPGKGCGKDCCGSKDDKAA